MHTLLGKLLHTRFQKYDKYTQKVRTYCLELKTGGGTWSLYEQQQLGGVRAAGRLALYYYKNDVHKAEAFVDDVYIEPKYRGLGLCTEMLYRVISVQPDTLRRVLISVHTAFPRQAIACYTKAMQRAGFTLVSYAIEKPQVEDDATGEMRTLESVDEYTDEMDTFTAQMIWERSG